MVPVLVVNPHDDTTFVEQVERCSDCLGSPEAMQASLRGDYPHALVRAREISDAAGEIWYVYRDGRWTPPRSMVRSDLIPAR